MCLACFACWGGGGIPTSIPTKLFHGPRRVRWPTKFPRSFGTTHQKISLSRERGGLGREIPRALRGPPSEDFTAQGGNVGGKFPQCFGATRPKKEISRRKAGALPRTIPRALRRLPPTRAGPTGRVHITSGTPQPDTPALPCLRPTPARPDLTWSNQHEVKG